MKWLLILLAALSLSLLSPAVMNALAGDKDKDDKEEKEEKDEKVTLDQCPEAVQKTIKKEAEGGKIEEIEKESKGNVIIFEAEIVKDGKTIEIAVANDGKLIKSKVKNGKEEDKDDDIKGDEGKGKEKGKDKSQ